MGDPAKRDESSIPNWFYMDDPNWVAAHGNDEKPLYMRCNWELNNDNLLDLSHVLYVHASTLGTGQLDRYPVSTERRPDSVRMARWAPNVPTPPIFAKYLGFQPNVDRWQISDIYPPAHCTVDVGFAPPGEFGLNSDRSKAMGFRPLITATPETETTSFMFYAQCRNFDLENAALTKTMIADFRGVFHEDVAVMEGQQRVNDAMPNAPKVDINADAPHIAMRQLIRRLAAAESSARPKATAAE
jgi:phenylpropionate dioxygenase-like ring-hydroxylating dioxygenase large terminal subunit